MLGSDQRYHVQITSLSAQGAGVFGDALPAVGTEVLLSWQVYDVAGEIIWVNGHRCGIKFSEPVSPTIIVALARGGGGDLLVRDRGGVHRDHLR
jgi:hypothetical protein